MLPRHIGAPLKRSAASGVIIQNYVGGLASDMHFEDEAADGKVAPINTVGIKISAANPEIKKQAATSPYCRLHTRLVNSTPHSIVFSQVDCPSFESIFQPANQPTALAPRC